MTTANSRTADYAIDPIFLERWSPRAFLACEMPTQDLMTILEAGRWAASAYNSQPWRFVYARRGTVYWQKFLGLLHPFNASWAGSAAALVLLVSKCSLRVHAKTDDSPLVSHSFDAGAAFANMALQAAGMGYQAHGMTGFDMERAMSELGIPSNHCVEAIAAIGRVGDKRTLPEALRSRETPSQRVPLIKLASEGIFNCNFL